MGNMMSGNGQDALQFSNIDAKIYGADIVWQATLTNDLVLSGNAAAIRGERTDEDDKLYRIRIGD